MVTFMTFSDLIVKATPIAHNISVLSECHMYYCYISAAGLSIPTFITSRVWERLMWLYQIMNK